MEPTTTTKEVTMPKLSEVAKIDGKLIYEDKDGNICTEDIASQCLRPLTKEEEAKLSKVSKKTAAVGGD